MKPERHAQRNGKNGCVLMAASVASMIDQFNRNNIRLMQEMGYVVHVACNFEEGNTCNAQRIRELKKELADQEVEWHQWDCPRSVRPVAKCWKAYRQLKELMARYHYEWMHCHSPIGGVLARLAAHQMKVRVIYTAHGFHFYKGAPLKNWLLYYPVEKLLARWTDALVTVNQEDYQFARRRLCAEKVYYIPGVGVDVKHFLQDVQNGERQARKKEFCSKYQISEQAFILLSVGELSKRKNHQMVIAVLAKMQRQDVYYLICGQGAEKKLLERQAEKLGVSKRVKLLGYQEDVDDLYQNADIFVFPSIQEGLPVALMEAMAAGLPCVVSDIRGNRELVDAAPQSGQQGREKSMPESAYEKSGGMRFSLQNPEQMQSALERLLADERLRRICGNYNQRKIKRYELSVVEKRMKKIYAENCGITVREKKEPCRKCL